MLFQDTSTTTTLLTPKEEPASSLGRVAPHQLQELLEMKTKDQGDDNGF